MERFSFEHSSSLQQEHLSNAVLEKLKDPTYLPSRQEIINALIGRDEWPDKWIEFFHTENNPTFEIFTKEYIEQLGNYLIEQSTQLQARAGEATILEVGAGNGRLTHLLQEHLKRSNQKNIHIIPIDIGTYGIKPLFPVELLEHMSALEKYQPQIIISCWMANGSDQTPDFRANPAVQEYILIGDDTCCGKPWETWGNPRWAPAPDAVPPYQADGFQAQKLGEMSALQICRSDHPGKYDQSKTVAFKRL